MLAEQVLMAAIDAQIIAFTGGGADRVAWPAGTAGIALGKAAVGPTGVGR